MNNQKFKTKKLIFIENEFHAEEFLKQKERFKDFTPITFNFKAEKMLSAQNISFKMDEEYENYKKYKGIFNSSVKSSLKLCKKIKIKYKEIDLMPLFFYDLYILFSSSKRNLILFKEIIKKESPSEIAFFEKIGLPFEREFASTILKYIFNGKLTGINYIILEKKIKGRDFLFDCFDLFQQKITKALLKLTKNKTKIFCQGSQIYFKDVLLKLKNIPISLIEFGDSLGKSFFISKKFVPFYKFNGIYSNEEMILNNELLNLTKKLNRILSPNKLNYELELEERINKIINKIIKNNFVQASRIINETISLVKNNKIKMFLMSDDTCFFGAIIARVSKKFNIKTMLFHHGFFFDEIGQNSVSDYLFVYGNQSKIESIKAGNSEKKIKVFGAPRYDSFIATLPKNNKKIIYAMEISSGNDALTPETQLGKKRQKELLRIIFKALKKFPEYKLIIKIRSKWDSKGLPELIAKEENFNNFEIIEKADNKKLIDGCDIMIVNQTTMGLEALIMNKPVISITYSDYDQLNFYRKINGVDIVYNQKELEKSIEKVILKIKKPIDKKRYFLEDFVVPDRNASEKIANFIKNTLKNEKK